MSPAEQHLKRAEELADLAARLLEHSHLADAVSRAYYAMFHAATAVPGHLSIERNSHHALWAAFGESVVRPGLMDPKYHRYGLDMLSARQEADYLAEPQVSLDAAQEQVNLAKEFVLACKQFLKQAAS